MPRKKYDGREGQGAELVPEVTAPSLPDRIRRQIDLGSVRACRRELAHLYRSARNGRVDIDAAAKLCYVLVSISKMIEVSDFEARVERLEHHLGR